MDPAGYVFMVVGSANRDQAAEVCRDVKAMHLIWIGGIQPKLSWAE